MRRDPFGFARLYYTGDRSARTIRDLLGVNFDAKGPTGLPEDPDWHGFERIGSELSLSPSHVDRYYRAAETVLDRAFPAATGQARKVRKTATELRYGGSKDLQAVLDRFGIKRPLRYLMFPGHTQLALSPNWFGRTGPEHSGLYKLRLQASGIRPPGGQTAHLSIGKRTSEETVLFGSLAITAATCVLFPFVADPLMLAVISFVFGLGLGCCGPLSMVITYNRAPAGRSGEAMGLRQSFNKFTEVLVPLIFGTVGSAAGIGAAFWMDAALLAGGLGLGLQAGGVLLGHLLVLDQCLVERRFTRDDIDQIVNDTTFATHNQVQITQTHIKIDDGGLEAAHGEAAGERGAGRRFADTALLIGDGYDSSQGLPPELCEGIYQK